MGLEDKEAKIDRLNTRVEELDIFTRHVNVNLTLLQQKISEEKAGMSLDDRMLLNSVKGKLLEWEDNVQNLYNHVRRLELLIIKQNEERPTSDLEFIETRLRALERHNAELNVAE